MKIKSAAVGREGGGGEKRLGFGARGGAACGVCLPGVVASSPAALHTHNTPAAPSCFRECHTRTGLLFAVLIIQFPRKRDRIPANNTVLIKC